jgi:uncharacterized protein YjbI with pentapeptide repeats
MANPEHLARFRMGIEPWNAWRNQNPDLDADLSGASMPKADLAEFNLARTNMAGADLSGANLRWANLRRANLSLARLTEADFSGADVKWAVLTEADASGAVMNGANLCDARLNSTKLNRTVLWEADLSRTNLSGADLSGAYLNNANLGDCNLTNATVVEAKLVAVSLVDADLSNANLSKSDLNGANLSGADLIAVNLDGARLNKAILNDADLTDANLRGAELREADLTIAKLCRTNLTATDLRSATLQRTNLEGANLTGARLWETQRARWSIKGVTCECAYWDEDGKLPTYYEPGEFERLYSEQTCVELFYEGGVSTFELNTLPALLHHLASLNPESNIRLKSVAETGGGARITINVGDGDPQTAEKIKADAMHVYQAQLVLREKETERLQIEKNYLESLFVGKLIPAMLSAGAPQNIFNAPVSGVVVASGESKVDFHQTVNDNSAVLALLERMVGRLTDLNLSGPEEAQFEAGIQAAKHELQKQSPDKSALAKSMQFIQKLGTEALTRAAGTLGEHIVSADWQSWLHQLSQFVLNLR